MFSMLASDPDRAREAAMSVKDLVEAIETALMEAAAAGKPLSSAEVVARFEGREGLTQYNVIGALRGMRMAGALIEIKGKLYLQRGFGGD